MTISEKINVCIEKIHKLMKEDVMFNNRTMHHILKSYSHLHDEIEKTNKISGKTYLKLIDLSEYITLIADRYCEKFEKMILKATELKEDAGIVSKPKKFNFERLTRKETEPEVFIGKVQKLWTRLGDVKTAALDCVKTNEMVVEKEN